MTAPAFMVELGFGATWQTEPASITWTEVTDYVLQGHRIRTRRGASSARGQVDVGSLSLSLRNEDRRFDPLHSSGPYFGDLKPGVPVRVRAVETLTWDGDPLTWDGEELVWGGDLGVWYGTVAKWPQRYDIGNTFGWVPVEAWDGFDKLSRAKIPRTVLEAEILADAPLAYWPLDETTGTQMGDRSGNGHHGEYVHGSTALSTETEAPGGGINRGVQFDGEHLGQSREAGILVDTRPVVVEFLATPESGITSRIAVRSGSGNPGEGITVQRDTTAWAASARVGGNDFVTSNTVDAGELHHHAYRCPASGDAVFYVDGTDDTATAGTTPGSSTAALGVALGARKLTGSTYVSPFVGFLGHVAIFGTDIGAARVLAHANAALAPLDNQTTDQRFGYVLDEIDWPVSLRDLETGNTSLGPATFKPGDSALEYFRLITATEDGLMFFTADGKFRFLNRYWRYQATAATVSQFTFTDQDGDQGYAEFQLDTDDELLVNIARFTRRDGVEQVASDATSVNTYGEAEKQQTNLLNRTDNEVRGLAQWTVVTQSEPQPRVPKIRIPLHRYSNADQETVLGLDLGHRVTVLRTPQGVGTAIDLDFVVDGISHDIGEGEWWTDLYVSPAPDNTANLFTLGTSQLGGTHILAY